MTRTEQLNALFEKWIKAVPEYKDSFYKDGIIDEEEYAKSSKKVLFIGKEPNDPGGSGDFREWFRQRDKPLYFANRMCEWAYGILNDFPPLEKLPTTLEEKKKILMKIAFMNLKKSGGGSIADHQVIKNVVERDRDFICEEISIISPDLIIGMSITDFWSTFFDDIKFKESGYDVKFAKFGSYVVIDFYHHSQRGPRAGMYCLLEKVINLIGVD